MYVDNTCLIIIFVSVVFMLYYNLPLSNGQRANACSARKSVPEEDNNNAVSAKKVTLLTPVDEQASVSQDFEDQFKNVPKPAKKTPAHVKKLEAEIMDGAFLETTYSKSLGITTPTLNNLCYARAKPKPPKDDCMFYMPVSADDTST